MESKMNKQSGDILVEPVVNQYGNKNKSKQFANTIDYLDEYDEYYLDNEKYIQTLLATKVLVANETSKWFLLVMNTFDMSF